ncbi:ABC transporter substrate-binding protein [Bradyrhizobium sp. OAE829]|uniref:ABC transporter substrate-binding protein n=1 Tax=Bradyrhizobium sp. OAE829 TaxID=2663807 RepID=UPI00178ABE01
MHRRGFIALLAGMSVPWASPLYAQQIAKRARIGVLGAATDNPVMGPAYRAFVEELRRLGFDEGQNLIVEHRPTEQNLAALSADAKELVSLNVDALVALGAEPSLKACISASRTIPIVFVANNFDPIALGYVTSLAKPGGNVTGVFLRQTELAEKQVELLTEAFPNRKRLAVFWDDISANQFSTAERRAKLLGLQIHSLKMQNPPYDFEAAFRSITDADQQTLLVLSSPFFARQNERLTELAMSHRLPSMFIFRAYTEAGGLMSYGADNIAMYRQSASHVAKILRGANPADLPVEQPTKFEFAVNLKTAKALNIELPTSILLRANNVTE